MGDFEIVVLPMITGGWLVVCAGLLWLERWVKVRYGMGREGTGGSVIVGYREDSEERGGRRKVDVEEKMYD